MTALESVTDIHVLTCFTLAGELVRLQQHFLTILTRHGCAVGAIAVRKFLALCHSMEEDKCNGGSTIGGTAAWVARVVEHGSKAVQGQAGDG